MSLLCKYTVCMERKKLAESFVLFVANIPAHVQVTCIISFIASMHFHVEGLNHLVKI